MNNSARHSPSTCVHASTCHPLWEVPWFTVFTFRHSRSLAIYKSVPRRWHEPHLSLQLRSPVGCGLQEGGCWVALELGGPVPKPHADVVAGPSTENLLSWPWYAGLLIRAALLSPRPPNARGIEAKSLTSCGCDSSICVKVQKHLHAAASCLRIPGPLVRPPSWPGQRHSAPRATKRTASPQGAESCPTEVGDRLLYSPSVP